MGGASADAGTVVVGVDFIVFFLNLGTDLAAIGKIAVPLRVCTTSAILSETLEV